MKILCIGGPVAGELYEQCGYHLVIFKPEPVTLSINNGNVGYAGQTTLYRMIKFEDKYLYIHESLKDEDIVTHILEGYIDSKMKKCPLCHESIKAHLKYCRLKGKL